MSRSKESVISSGMYNNKNIHGKSVKKRHDINSIASLNINQSSISLTENNSTKIPNHEDKLIKKLMTLQIELIAKINDLKAQKISVLENYNKEFDKFTALSLQNSKFQHTQQQNYVQHQDSHLQKEQKTSNEQFKLKRFLQQLYQLTQENNLQELKLNVNQLQDLTKLINLHSQNILKNSQHRTIQGLISQNTLQSIRKQPIYQLHQGITQSQEIFMLKQAIQNYLPQKLSSLQSQQKMLKIFQNQSRANVESLIKRRSMLEKQVSSLNQLQKQYESKYELYKSRQSIMPSEGPIPDWVVKYEKFIEYKQLQCQYKKYEQKVRNKLINAKKQNSYEKEIQQKLKSKENQVIKSIRQNDKKNRQSFLITQDYQIKIKRLQQQLRRYEEFLRNENENKVELFNEIILKQNQFNQIRTQNQIMQNLLKLIN